MRSVEELRANLKKRFVDYRRNINKLDAEDITDLLLDEIESAHSILIEALSTMSTHKNSIDKILATIKIEEKKEISPEAHK